MQIQGQIYHRTGSLLPLPDSNYNLLQIYFMGDSANQVDQRCAHNNSVKRPIVEQLQTFFHQHNDCIIQDRMPFDNHKIVIRADKTPAGQHARRFNALTFDEVAIIVVGENLEFRDICVTINCSVCLKHIDHMLRYNILSYFDKVKMGIIFKQDNKCSYR